MVKGAVKSASLCDQRLYRLSLLPNARKCMSDTAVSSVDYLDNNGGTELLMESVVSTETRHILRDALKEETFAAVYNDLLTSNSIMDLTDDHVKKLISNIISAQKFIDAVLSKARQSQISQQGFVRCMNSTSRLVLDCLVERKSGHLPEYELSSISDSVMRQWQHLTVLKSASSYECCLVCKGLLRKPRKHPRVCVRKDVEERSNVDSQDAGLSSASVTSLPSPAVNADDSVVVLEVSGDGALGRRREDDVIVEVDINDSLTFQHEQVVENSPADVSSSSDDDRLYIDCQLTYSSQSTTSCLSTDRQSSPEPKVCRKRKTTPAYFEPIKRTKLSSIAASVTSYETGPVRQLKRSLDSGEEREMKRMKEDIDVPPPISVTWRSPPSDRRDAMIWPEVEGDTLHVYVSKECSERRYRRLSRGLCGTGELDLNTGLLFSIALPQDEPILSQDIINFFCSEPWCTGLYDMDRTTKLYVRDTVTADLITDIILQQKLTQGEAAQRRPQ